MVQAAPPPVGAGPAVREARLELGDCDRAEAPRAARLFARERCAEWGVDDDTTDAALLLVSELVTNAARHAPPPLVFRFTYGPTGLRGEVADSDARVPSPKRPDHESAGGRGLWLIEVLSDAWGYDLEPPGKLVWFLLRRAPWRRPPETALPAFTGSAEG